MLPRNACRRRPRAVALLMLIALIAGCSQDSAPQEEPEEPDEKIFRIPVVVHVIHNGEAVGDGSNLSQARIEGQIRILNEDYRRKPGTPGFNDHPDGGDARIEFVLARRAPDGSPTNGIVRIDASTVSNPHNPADFFAYYPHYSYWNPEHYLNIWTIPLPEWTVDVVLGFATGPNTDLPGGDLFAPGEPTQPEGVIINAPHFGESDLKSEHVLGRTLTHEVGHFLGLLHTWGGRDCENNDYCDDTPAVDSAVVGCPPEGTLGCSGEPIMVGNYMNYTADRCMNIFTKDQIARMHYVLHNSPRRTSLLASPALGQ